LSIHLIYTTFRELALLPSSGDRLSLNWQFPFSLFYLFILLVATVGDCVSFAEDY
jgi:hypothetical protein